jgi:hypothetical protein
MTQRRQSETRRFSAGSFLYGLIALLVFAAAPGQIAAEPTPAAIAAFNSYVGAV